MGSLILNAADMTHRQWRDEVREIFLLTSQFDRKRSSADHEAFFQRWTSWYFDNWVACLWLACAPDGSIDGYLMGAIESANAVEHFTRVGIKSYALFADQFARLPAHLHINCHPRAQGRGLGSSLLIHFLRQLRQAHVAGVHLITQSHQRNVEFYRRNGFTIEIERPWRDTHLLLMGQTISA